MIKMNYSLGLYEKAMPNTLPWEEKLTIAKKSGFDYLEMSVDETDEKLARLEWSKEERESLLDLMHKHDFYIRSMCLSGHRKYPLGSPDEKIRQQSLDIMEKAIQLADDLGIRIIQLAGYDVYYEEGNAETEHYFKENLKKAVEMASEKGIILGFETMETNFMNTVSKSMKYVKQIRSPYLQVYPDLGNLTNAALASDRSVYADIDQGQGHIVAAHLKETVPNVFREVPFGTGHVDFSKGIEKLFEHGVNRFVAEFWYTGNPEWEKDLVQANEFIRSHIEKGA
ncbi:L-ribulose-5-phosphate 3-epimerase [Jeotgalibaca ciconiae]|uniref:L-ribulose-5-phosphate 3-epimerase n=2 Tax=Jeotgalibaca ciconiae TaxID=2496265 RepID=A0A3S9HBX5_9LACT|nr:L-ribulose-5-phosphate 3-epimerase [Jeotgalibaca ciconiae]